MSLLYPIAQSARAALAAPEPAARSKADAVRLCPLTDHHIKRLETEWLTLSPQERDSLDALADAGVSAGFVQRYENAQGDLVLAVSYWKMLSDKGAEDGGSPVLKAEAEPKLDHTDDLYFRAGRTKKRRRKKLDPNQLDLFGKPEE